MRIIDIENISKNFGKKKVLSEINFTVNKREILGIIGPSGSGKSVLVKILIGFLKPNGGKIKIAPGIKIGFSMQNNSLYNYLTVKQNLKYFSKIYGVPRKERKIKIPEMIEKLSLKEYENVLIKNLSGGTKKRVDIGCALINNPDIIILDEPFTGLDPLLIKNLSSFITSLKRSGKTVIISSHMIRELSEISSRTIKINKI